MDYVLYLLRALYRVKWWILLGTALITAIVYFRTGNLKGGYNVEATLYTGVVSGYGVEESTKVDWALAQNSMDNLEAGISAPLLTDTGKRESGQRQ